MKVRYYAADGAETNESQNSWQSFDDRHGRDAAYRRSRALEMALSLDVPFWRNCLTTATMKTCMCKRRNNFPGIILDLDKRTLRFSYAYKFVEELEEALLRFDDPTYFDVSETYSEFTIDL